MEKTMYVAKALYDMYRQRNGRSMDEMKMHKLMYFSQRESLMCNNEPLFDGAFYAWKYGPVSKEVRSAYMLDAFSSDTFDNVSDGTMVLLNSVLDRYGSLSPWKLSSLSHEEFSWKKARNGLDSWEDGDVEMSLDAMRVDAARELANRKMDMTFE